MLSLPSRIEAQLVGIEGSRLRAEDVLVGLNILRAGEYYYGNLVGLTDPDGIASVSRDELDLRFAADRVDYPMDYRTALEECDPLIEVCLLSGKEVSEAERGIASSPHVSDEIRRAYAKTSNQAFWPALVRVWAHLPGKRAVVVHLPTGRIG